MYLENYLKKIRKDIKISLNVDKSSKLFTYELKSAYIYDIISNQNCAKKEFYLLVIVSYLRHVLGAP